MAFKGVEMVLVLFSVLVLWNGAAAQSGCTRALMSLLPCLNYVNGNSSTPSSSCCSQLSNIVQSQPRCLCSLLNGGGVSFGVSVNQSLALALPGACNLQTPPVSQCNAATTTSGPSNSAAIPGPASAPVGSPAESTPAAIPGPASAPVGSPAESTPADSSEDTPTTGSDSNIPAGSKTVPKTGVASDGSTIKSTLHNAVFLVFVISCASAATGF